MLKDAIMKKIIGLMMVLTLVFACNSAQKDDAKDVGDAVQDLTEQVASDIKEQWNDLKSSLESYLDKIDAKIKDIDNQLADASGDTKTTLEKKKQDLINWKNKVQDKLKTQQDDAAKHWDAFKKETREYFAELDKALRDDS